MSKNKKKNLKKVHAKINNTPAKAEGAKKEESKVPNKKLDKKSAKKAKEAAKYAASKARIEARNAAKKARADKLEGIKKENAKEPVKITVEMRKAAREERRKVAYNRHIASIKRRCKRMNLDDDTTLEVVNVAKKQWDSAKAYNVVIVYSEASEKNKKDVLSLCKDANISNACVTNSTAFINNVPKDSVDKLHELLNGATIYQYRTDKKNPFDEVGIWTPKTRSKGATEKNSRECSKSRSINFYNLRRLKKAEKEKMEKNTYNFRHGSKAEGRRLRRILKKTKPVNKKPTQIKEIKSKSNKQAA